MKNLLRLVITGGGTGGHLFPALALAQEFKRRYPHIEIVFIGGRGGLEERVIPSCGYRLELLDVEAIKKKRTTERIRALWKAFRSTIKAIGLLRTIKPQGVIGSGSYSSAPVVVAARLLGIRTAILEQNALPGLTNRLLGRIVDRIYISFKESEVYFPRGRTVLTGNPVRRDILEGRGEIRNGKFSLLVFGGSQGATTINAAFLDAVEYLTDIWDGLRVVHQTGEEGYEMALSSYRRKGLKVEVFKFIDNMADAYRRADLVICRAGATSIAEITALGLPAIVVPYPFAADDHQEINARVLAEKGAVVMIKQESLTGSTLADAIRRFYENPGELERIKKAVKGFARPGAGETIVEDYTRLIEGRR